MQYKKQVINIYIIAHSNQKYINIFIETDLDVINKFFT